MATLAAYTLECSLPAETHGAAWTVTQGPPLDLPCPVRVVEQHKGQVDEVAKQLVHPSTASDEGKTYNTASLAIISPPRPNKCTLSKLPL
eukprot:1144872-Pelagomonas_calceolata.AAC.2